MALTLTQVRQFCAREAGRFLSSTASGSSATTALVDTNYPVASSISQATLFQDWYIFRPSASAASDKVRVVLSYTPASTGGTLTPDSPWTNAPASGEAYELHGLFDPVTEWLTFINDGLKRCFLSYFEFSLSPIAQQTRHSLASAAPWLTDPKWVRAVGWLSQGQTNRLIYKPTPVRGEAYIDGASNTVWIDHYPQTFNATDMLYVYAVCPAYNACYAQNGTPGSQNGLALETDGVNVELEWAGYAALTEAYRRLTQAVEPDASARWIKKQAEAAAMYSHYTDLNFVPPELAFRRLAHWGPSHGSGLIWPMTA